MQRVSRNGASAQLILYLLRSPFRLTNATASNTPHTAAMPDHHERGVNGTVMANVRSALRTNSCSVLTVATP